MARLSCANLTMKTCQQSVIPVLEDCYSINSQVLLLPQSRIAVVTGTHVKISVINPAGSDGLILQPIFSMLLDPISLHRQPYRLHSTFYYSYLKITSQDSILEIQFPHDTNEVYQKTITIAHGPCTSAVEGPSLLIRRLDDKSVDFISYGPEERGLSEAASQICVPADVFRTHPLLTACDVASGRLITSWDRERMLLQI
jgi:hypothetical protein